MFVFNLHWHSFCFPPSFDWVSWTTDFLVRPVSCLHCTFKNAAVAFRANSGEQKSKGHCTLSPKFSCAFFSFFVFLILSYLNACYGCENTENRTWSEFFYVGRKFRSQCVNVIDTTWSYLFFKMRKFRTKISDSVCNDLHTKQEHFTNPIG